MMILNSKNKIFKLKNTALDKKLACQKPPTQFIKIYHSSIHSLDQLKLTDRQVQYCLAIYHCTRKRGFILRQNGVMNRQLLYKLKSSLGISRSQLSRIIDVLIFKGIIKEQETLNESIELVFSNIFAGVGPFTMVPIKGIYRSGFRAKAFIQQCIIKDFDNTDHYNPDQLRFRFNPRTLRRHKAILKRTKVQSIPKTKVFESYFQKQSITKTHNICAYGTDWRESTILKVIHFSGCLIKNKPDPASVQDSMFCFSFEKEKRARMLCGQKCNTTKKTQQFTKDKTARSSLKDHSPETQEQLNEQAQDRVRKTRIWINQNKRRTDNISLDEMRRIRKEKFQRKKQICKRV